MAQPRLLHCFLNANLRAGHDGLSELAARRDVSTATLSPGEYVIFVNRARDKLKMYAAHGVLAYLRMERGQRIDLRTLSLIPAAFLASGRINYNEALRNAVTQALSRAGERGQGVLQLDQRGSQAQLQ